MKATGFLCQAEEGERGRENVFMTCNSEIATSSAFLVLALEGGGNWVILQHFQSTHMFSSPLFPSLLRLAREWLKFQTIGGTPCSYCLLC